MLRAKEGRGREGGREGGREVGREIGTTVQWEGGGGEREGERGWDGGRE